MHRISTKLVLAVVCLLALAPAISAAQVKLNNVPFPEKRTIHLTLQPTSIAPTAKITADVNYKQGQARIDVFYTSVKPAILFGGDVTCFVVWAVTRDGRTENLGELLTRKSSGKMSYSTGKKSFSLMVTAESFYLVNQPSELVVFYNRPSIASEVRSAPFVFESFEPAPRHNTDGIAHLRWDSVVPIELLQARKAFELSGRNDAAIHAREIYSEARVALSKANRIAASAPKSRELLDVARRAVALSNEAINISMHRIKAIELERSLTLRREETEALERRAADAEAKVAAAEQLTAQAESSARTAEQFAVQVRAEAEQVRAEKDRMVTETVALRSEKSGLEGNMLQLRMEKSDLIQQFEQLNREKSALANDKVAIELEAERLRGEKATLESSARRLQAESDELSGRLQSALSHVAETNSSNRGLVVNLPDILFDVDEDQLKPEAEVVLAKLAGILLMMRDHGAVIEGHTDATGEAAYNRDLSQRRASSVMDFIQSQGLPSKRLRAVGYGMDRPVADNSTAVGRGANRRVEIVISEVQPGEAD